MKKTAIRSGLALIAGAFTFAPLGASLAADTNSSTADTAAPAPVISTAPAAVKLPYGVEDVLKLSRAQVGEEIILNYVQSSGTIYNLAPKDIVYLRDQGVSDKVINAMLDQRKRVELASQAAAAAAVANQAPTAPVATGAPDAAAGGAPNYAGQGTTYAEAPLTPQGSSAYVIPYAPSYYAPAPYYYPYYGPAYYGWYGPSIAFGFRFGGHGGFRGHSFGGHGFGGHHR